MKRKFLPITLLLAGIMMLASCLSDDDNYSNIQVYGDAAITSFSLGTLNKTYLYNNGDTIKKTTNGKDSTTTVDCSSYKMIINQLEREICNADSLPAGTDLRKVVCTVNTKNSGIVAVQRLTSDTLDYYNSDSLDFTKPRKFFIYSTDGSNRRQYDVKLLVHNEQPDSFAWHKHNVPALQQAALKDGKLLALGNEVLLAATDGQHTRIFGCDIDKDNWRTLADGHFQNDAFNSVAAFNNSVYVLDRQNLYSTADGAAWQQLSLNGVAEPQLLLGAGTTRMYVKAADGVYGSKDAAEWTKCQTNGDINSMPDHNYTVSVLPSKTNAGIERLVMVGQNTAVSDTAAIVWGKLDDRSEAGDSYAWSLYEGGRKNLMPCMANTSVMVYDGKLFAIGGEGLNGSRAKAYNRLYCSVDQGLTWLRSKLFTLPADLPVADGNVFLMGSDKKNHVWIVCLTTGEVWKTRVNRLGWKGAY